MKKTLIPITLLVLALLTGCTVARTLDRAEERIEDQIEHSIVTLVTPIPDAELPMSPGPNQITEADAINIALEHAQYNIEQVRYINTSYDSEHGIPRYEVEFRIGRTEFEYEIHAESGKVLSYEIDR